MKHLLAQRAVWAGNQCPAKLVKRWHRRKGAHRNSPIRGFESFVSARGRRTVQVCVSSLQHSVHFAPSRSHPALATCSPSSGCENGESERSSPFFHETDTYA